MTEKTCLSCKWEPAWFVISPPGAEEVKWGSCQFPVPPGLPPGCYILTKLELTGDKISCFHYGFGDTPRVLDYCPARQPKDDDIDQHTALSV
jgi:hypothetical protein